MKLLKYITFFIFLICIATGCKKDALDKDTSFVSGGASASNLSVMFNITHDNTGLVTITPNGAGALSYTVDFGDGTSSPVNISAGKNVQHTYAEGTYQVKLTAHDIKGGTATLTQPLVVSFLAPQNLAVVLSKTNLTVNVSATAKYATFFKIYFGDSTSVSPVPFTNALAGQTIVHNYAKSGTYIVNVVALSGGSETAQFNDTITVAKQINLPVNFDDPNTDYTMSDFGGDASSVTADPTNASNHVLKAIKTSGAQTWGGTTIGTGLGFATPVPFGPGLMRVTVDVYSPAAGIDIKLKMDNHANPNVGLSVETDVLTTKANQWETLTFDFTKPAAGTPAYSASNVYDLASIFFDFNNPGNGATYYIDNIQMAPPTLKQINLPVTFEDATVDYTMLDFGGNVSTLVADPTNASNHVMQAIKTNGAATYAGVTLGNGFSSPIPISTTNEKMTLMVYSPAAGIDVKLKLDNHLNANNGLSVETDVLTTKVNQWELLTFDFSKNAANTPAFNPSNVYDLAVIFFDFGNTGNGATYYWDNLQMQAAPVLQQIDLPVTFEATNVDYTMTDFAGAVSTLVADPDPSNPGNHVMQSVKTQGAITYAGTTIGKPAGFAHAIPLGAGHMKMTVMVYSPAAGIDVKLKLDTHLAPNSGLSVETDALTTKVNQWETLTFDFTQNASGTPAYNSANTYDQANIFFDFGNTGNGATYYWDNLMLL